MAVRRGGERRRVRPAVCLGDGEVLLVVYQADLGEVEDLDQPQALLRPVEAEAEAVLG